MIGETHFQRYIPEPHAEDLVAPEQIRRHILCTGLPFISTIRSANANAAASRSSLLRFIAGAGR